MALTLLVGLIQAFFAVFHVGFVAKYLSDVIVTGFTTGAAFHIILSQVNPFLGISAGKVTTCFKLIGVINHYYYKVRAL
jgi:MFS superfamily sulfate permease-like transporter